MATRFADAEWRGDLQKGQGKMRLGTGMFEGNYTYKSRFTEGPGTNPEELIAAASAGCFTMAFSNELSKAGFTPTLVKTHAEVTMETVDNAPTIKKVHLTTEADVPGIDEKRFQEIGEGAKKNCPVSRALAAIQIELTARLVQSEKMH
jgi:lipoyl-dependent peroxiredoxin